MSLAKGSLGARSRILHHGLKFDKRSQHFLSVHNESLTVVVMDDFIYGEPQALP
jgi:hypothetical protein